MSISHMTTNNTNQQTQASQFDPKAIFSNNSVALTLIRADHVTLGIQSNHAEIVIETLDEHDKLNVKIAHFVGPYSYDNNAMSSHFLHSDKGAVLVDDMSNKHIKFSEKSCTWVVSKENAALMLDIIEKERSKKIPVPPFYLLGGNSILSSLSDPERNGRIPNNCIHWALDKLRLAGINLQHEAFILATNTHDYTSRSSYKLKEYGIEEFCIFIRQDNIDAIHKFFPPNKIDINQTVSGATMGPVETHLRNYSPLMRSLVLTDAGISRNY